MAKHILNYLRANNFTKVSFDRIRERINADYSDKLLLKLIDTSPDKFRRVNMKGDKPGSEVSGKPPPSLAARSHWKKVAIVGTNVMGLSWF
jgi:hypothetical protein